jgi:hypothetical protein
MRNLINSIKRTNLHKEQNIHSWHGYDISENLNLSFNEAQNKQMINEVLWKLSLCTIPIPENSENRIFDRMP